MLELARGWSAELQRGPNWLFVRLHVDPDTETPADQLDVAEPLWNMLQRGFVQRIVLELDELPKLRSHFIGELVRLHKRIHSSGGVFRLSGLSDENQQVLRISRLDDRFPHYRNRDDAVRGGGLVST